MKQVIQTHLDLCTGCNRCVRECPMEMANVTYQDDEGAVRVTIDQEKCISCGRCLTACKHGARYYIDDVESFFANLASGIPISLMTAPAIRTNIPEYKRLFTYLKSIGVRKIYDVSLGADISIWGHVRYLKANKDARLITQPCPVMVSYCLIYQQELLPSLSPVHSPMACAAIYMKKYEGISDHLAALSPCAAKLNEFDQTGVIEYNLTFTRLLEYLQNQGVELPEEETGFDHYESDLGSLFPMPGGLKENIEFFLSKDVSVDRAEGYTVFENLRTYAASTLEMLPNVFDVLNCQEGCNGGMASTHVANTFAINRSMDKSRHAATPQRREEYYVELYRQYDSRLQPSDFIREYEALPVTFPVITEEDVNHAFELLAKDEDSKKHIDCGACGSDTCYEMARRIALGLNIPNNCIVKSMEIAKLEHEQNLAARDSLALLEQLREADERMRMLMDTTPIGAKFWNSDLEITDCNQELIRLFEMPDKQSFISNFFALSPTYQPDGSLSREKCLECVRKAFETGFQRYNWTYQTYDGQLIPSEITLVRVDYKDEQLVASYTRDLREQTRMLQEIEATSVQLQKALEQAEDAVHAYRAAQSTTAAMFSANPQINVLFNSQFQAVDCNPAAVRFLGFESKEDALEGFLERLVRAVPLFQSSGQPSISLAEMLIIATRVGQIKFETEIIIDAMTRILSVELIRIPYENSTAIVAFFVDMTTFYQRELELTMVKELNELQLTMLDTAVKATKIGLWNMEIIRDDPMNPDNVFHWSDEFRQMLGFDDENDFPNLLVSWSSRLHPADKDRILTALADHLADKTGQTPFDVEYRMQLKNGNYAYFRAFGGTIRDEEGNPLRVVGSLMDITEAKTILLDTDRQRIEAEAANIAKSAFLSTMSHEIRTPMNAILGITEIQLQKDDLDDSVRESLGRIYTSGDMLLGIINDILDLSKIEAGKLELSPDRYELASLISDTAQLNVMRIGSKPIEFELDVDARLPAQLIGDELRIKQILNNILSNAFKYTAEGTVRLGVTCDRCEESEGERVKLIITVSDTGHGMSKEQVDKLFDEYSRFNLETNRSTEGTGLGMSITRNLVHLMQGQISVESELGKGSTFTICLPQEKIDDELLGEELAENLHQFRSANRAQMKRVQVTREYMPYGSVLIVDDVETNIFVARGLLAPYGLRIESANSGQEAIEAIKNGNVYDIIFMDHMMPAMDGVEATRIMRSMGYDHPIVALTANAVVGQVDVFLNNGFDDFISKPIDIRQLNQVLNKHIRNKQTPEVLEEARQVMTNRREPEPVETTTRPEINPRYAAIFSRDARKAIAILEKIDVSGGRLSEDDLRTYNIYVHGIKSALANIGIMDLSERALRLEICGRTGDLETIAMETEPFLNALRALVEDLTVPETVEGLKDEHPHHLRAMLHEIKTACEEFDELTAEKILIGLKTQVWSVQTREMLETISGHLLHSDFEAIITLLENLPTG